jgi:hypothetical protein
MTAKKMLAQLLFLQSMKRHDHGRPIFARFLFLGKGGKPRGVQREHGSLNVVGKFSRP